MDAGWTERISAPFGAQSRSLTLMHSTFGSSPRWMGPLGLAEDARPPGAREELKRFLFSWRAPRRAEGCRSTLATPG